MIAQANEVAECAVEKVTHSSKNTKLTTQCSTQKVKTTRSRTLSDSNTTKTSRADYFEAMMGNAYTDIKRHNLLWTA